MWSKVVHNKPRWKYTWKLITMYPLNMWAQIFNLWSMQINGCVVNVCKDQVFVFLCPLQDNHSHPLSGGCFFTTNSMIVGCYSDIVGDVLTWTGLCFWLLVCDSHVDHFYLKALRQQPEESVGNVRVDENRGRRRHMLTLVYGTRTNITKEMCSS